ncbi:MAG: hypothetical protein ACKO04_04530 [Actinomycetes bacterium]
MTAPTETLPKTSARTAAPSAAPEEAAPAVRRRGSAAVPPAEDLPPQDEQPRRPRSLST